ncbi:M20/M25/M40 family metallo-hydrolase [Neobacillus drentensis]|uniref:M20/M25/M40 family metallo-hydrolase n=1 Tax=Neobacillus drentensis TaxID=220684 RepID=UPI002FFDD8D4
MEAAGLSVNNDDKESTIKLLMETLQEIQNRSGVTIEYEMLSNEKPVQLSSWIAKMIQSEADSVNYSYYMMHSGADHDAMNLVPIMDVGMIFIPSKDGISHNIAEYSSLEDITNDANVSLNSIY